MRGWCIDNLCLCSRRLESSSTPCAPSDGNNLGGNVFQLDVVICTYNNASLLDRTLDFLGKQQVAPDVEWGVLIVDNNCTDSTSDVIEKHLRSGRIPCLSRVVEPRQGLTPARLCGVMKTSADWLAFLDDDCLVSGNWIAHVCSFAQTHPTCGAFGGKVIPEWEHPPPAWLSKFGYCFAEQDHGATAKQVPCLVGAGMVINRAALCRSGWPDRQFLQDRIGHELVSGGDVEIALRLGALSSLWYTPECSIRHFIPSWRTSAEYLSKINRELGTSKLLGDSMLWSGCWIMFVVSWSFRTFRELVRIALRQLRATRHREATPEIAISATFIEGEWAGIRLLISMDSELRRALVGCAKLETRGGS